MIERPPELADGGWWSVVPAVERQIAGRTRRLPDLPAGVSFTAVPLEDGRFVVRLASPVVGVPTLNESAGAALVAAGHSQRPRLRIRGR